MGGISDKQASDCLLDHTDHKLTLAQYHLKRVDSKISYNYDLHHFQQEYHLESFTIFSTMVIESLCFEINKEFGFPERDRIENIIANLINSSDTRHQNILTIINDYFARPPVTLGINDQLPDNTVLWQLRAIRNKIAHVPIFNRAIIAGDRTRFLVRFPRDDGIVLERIIENPNETFQNYFDKLVEFRDKIRSIIPHTHPSSLYKILPDSELKSLLS